MLTLVSDDILIPIQHWDQGIRKIIKFYCRFVVIQSPEFVSVIRQKRYKLLGNKWECWPVFMEQGCRFLMTDEWYELFSAALRGGGDLSAREWEVVIRSRIRDINLLTRRIAQDFLAIGHSDYDHWYTCIGRNVQWTFSLEEGFDLRDCWDRGKRNGDSRPTEMEIPTVESKHSRAIMSIGGLCHVHLFTRFRLCISGTVIRLLGESWIFYGKPCPCNKPSQVRRPLFSGATWRQLIQWCG